VDGLADLEKTLTPDNLAGWLRKLHEREVEVTFPKFRMTQKVELAGTLAALGMPLAFRPNQADFSGIDGSRELFISAVVHKAFVDVNEEGTEAAAATGLELRATAVPLRNPAFRADHPFLFLIRDRRSGSVLFMGRLVEPTAVSRD
jgi:serpin B